MTHLLIDLDGVLYEGEQPVPGAADTLAWLAREKIQPLFVTNTTSRPRGAIADKLAAYGIEVDPEQILTPPVAARGWLGENAPGTVAAFVPAPTLAEFSELPLADAAHDEPVAAVVIGDYGENWNFAELNRAFRMLMAEPAPALVALGMTRYWRAPDGLRLDTAPFVMALSHASGIEPVVLGKPARPFFEAALTRLGATAEQTLMIGDDIRTDIDAAQAVGVRGILVRTGKFGARDLELGIRPHAVLGSIAELPEWWSRNEQAR